MRRSLSLFLFIYFSLITTPVLSSDQKITFLNLEAVLNQTNVGKIIVTKLNNLKISNNENFKQKSEDLKKKEKILITQKNILSKEEFETNLISLQKEIDVFNQNNNKSLLEYEKVKKKELDKFIKKITPLIENYIAKNSISIVINQKNIFIGNTNHDITKDIINYVNDNLKLNE